MIGELISHYRITRQIGAGGLGVVYLERDEQLEPLAATEPEEFL